VPRIPQSEIRAVSARLNFTLSRLKTVAEAYAGIQKRAARRTNRSVKLFR
jgi:hypothetical protein